MPDIGHRHWIGIDTGGTFTDVVLVELETGRYLFRKVPSNPKEPAEAVMRGLREIIAEAGIGGETIDLVALGTTLATNAMLEGKTGRAALLTTAGFQDVLELARQRRPDLYNLRKGKPRHPIPPELRIEVPERLAADGAVVVPLDEAVIEEALAPLAGSVEAVAICFLHAYRNDEHERRAAAVVARVLPDVRICLSCEINPEFREYERVATTCVNAVLLPVMDRYLAEFARGVAARGIASVPYVMQSSGGLVSPTTLERVPINTFFSGPAGGVIGATRLGGEIGLADLITIDIGGTSTDVCLVKDGQPQRTTQQSMAGVPVRTPALALHTIGAGGGSLAWVDAGGLPKVGPESAGALPGPAAYGRGGTRPTVTDANIVLGRLSPIALLDGTMRVDPQAARRAIETHVARHLGVAVERAAAGILEIANLGMVGAVRVISVERGEDPRRFALVAFGGAGPLHAAEIAEQMGISQIIVPAHPGLLSAMGLLSADIRGDFGQSCLAPAGPKGLDRIGAALGHVGERARRWIADERLDAAAAVRLEWTIELRYAGQSSELVIGLPAVPLTEAGLAGAVAAFHDHHRARYGYGFPDRQVEAVAVRVAAAAGRPPLPAEQEREPDLDVTQTIRQVWFPETGFVSTRVVRRSSLVAGSVLSGPAIIEQMDTTTVVPPSWTARSHRHGNLLLERSP